MDWTLEDGWWEAHAAGQPCAVLTVAPDIYDRWAYSVEFHDGVPSMPDGLPRTVAEVQGFGLATEDDARFAAERHYDRVRIAWEVWAAEAEAELDTEDPQEL